MYATVPQKKGKSDGVAPVCSAVARCGETPEAPCRLTLPCSKGFAMVTSWASCCSQENCASDHFTLSWGSWPWIRKHCGAGDVIDTQLYVPGPHTQKPLLGSPQQRMLRPFIHRASGSPWAKPHPPSWHRSHICPSSGGGEWGAWYCLFETESSM